LNDTLIDLIQEFWREQTDVVLERLEMVIDIVKGPVTQHLAKAVVLIDQFMHAVIVAVQIEPKYTADQNRPQRHAGATI